MEPPDLPPELAELEVRLQGRRQAPLPPELRDRVLAAVRQGTTGRRSWLPFAAGLAAAALLGLNLTLTAVNHTDFLGREADSAAATAALVQQIQEVVPEWSPREARGRALLYGAQRFAAPALPAGIRPAVPSGD